MRAIITVEEANALLDVVPRVEPKPYYNTALRQLQDYYEKKLAAHDCGILIETLLSIYRKREEVLAQKRKFGAIDERYMKRIEDLLFGELSVALGVEKIDVRRMMADKLNEKAE